jgi:pSer/pThr/pTyr-binding forkhead associated (FHA) protein
MDPNTLLGVGGIGSVIVATGLIMLCGHLLKLQLNPVKIFVSTLASMTGTSLAFLLIQRTALTGAVTWAGDEVKLVLVGIVIPLALCVVILAGCLAVISELSAPIAFSLSLFAVGGSIVVGVLSLYGYNDTRIAINAISQLQTVTYVALGVGVVLALVGYAIGSANGGALVSNQVSDQINVNVNVIQPVDTRSNHETISAAASNAKLTQSSVATIVQGSNNRVATTAWLSVVMGPMRGARFDLNGSELKIGRASTCPIKITGDEEVGREHALVRFANGHHVLYDLASVNRTYLNDNVVTDPRQLMSGDKIRVGKTVIEFVEAGK